MNTILYPAFGRKAPKDLPGETIPPCQIIIFPGIRVAREEPPEVIFDEPGGEGSASGGGRGGRRPS